MEVLFIMKIDSMDALRTGQQAAKFTSPERVNQTQNKSSTGKAEIKTDNLNARNNVRMSEYDINDMTISDKAVIEAIERANDALSVANRKFEYSIHEETKEIMVKVIDSETDEVICEIPPEKILDMVAKMWEMAGILVDERR
jgi:flagellar protein FlaG